MLPSFNTSPFSMSARYQSRIRGLISSSMFIATYIGLSVSNLQPAIAQSFSETSSLQIEAGSQSLTWEEFTAFTTIPASEIAEVALTYSWTGDGSYRRDFNAAIEKTANGYRTNTGETIDRSLVAGLSESLTQLRWSSIHKSCIDMTHNYPFYQIVVTFEGGQEVGISSNSNCGFSIPWNVVYQDQQYVQYTGEISVAVYSLLAALPNNPFERRNYSIPKTIDATAIFGEFPIGHYSLQSVDDSLVTEELLYQKVLSQSERFAQFSPFYDIHDMALFCSLHVDNPQCLNLTGELVLKSKTTGQLFPISIQTEGEEITTITPAGELLKDLESMLQP